MARENFILKTLLEAGEVIWEPRGNSMTPKIDSGDRVIIKKLPANIVQVGDIVYAKVKGKYYLHLVSAIEQDRYLIKNAHGWENGWTKGDNVFGICVQVKDRILLSDKDIEKRIASLIKGA